MSASQLGTYAHVESGMSFDYPAGWTVEELPDSVILILCDEIEEDWQANVSVDFQPLNNRDTISSFVHNLINNYKFLKQDFRMEDLEVVAKTEVPHAKLEFSHLKDSTRLLTFDFMVQHSPSVLVIASATTAISRKDKYSPLFKQIVNSIKFG